MSNFTLLEYTTEKNNFTLGKVNFLKKNCTNFKNPSVKPFLDVFEKGIGKIKRDYIIEMKKIYNVEEEFHFLVPVSSCDYFVQKIKEWIEIEFPYAIDISDCFSENQEINMAVLADEAEQSLRQSLVISSEINNYNIIKLFIGDDVFSTGTSIRVYQELIQEKFDYDIEFSYGTLIKTQ